MNFRMVYHRKSSRGSYGVDNLQEALRQVRAGEISKRKAESVYGIPRRTLSRHMKGEVHKIGNLGRFDCDLAPEYEAALVSHALELQKMLFGLNTVELRKLAFELAEKQEINHRFKNKTAGKTWLKGFLRRHPELAIRSPEATSLGRAVGFNKPSVDKFFNLYKSELEKHTYTADRVFNMDETGLTVVHKPRKVLAQRGDKQVGRITSGEKGETMTVICAISASGTYVPPMLIYKRKRMSELLMKGSPPGSIGACSANGWIDGELFLKWLNHFISCVKPTPEKKVLLIMDGHSSHKSLAAIELARSNSLVMICLPPHTTHKMQPLDRAVYGPLKVNYNCECDKWMTMHAGQRISQYDQAELFGRAYVRTATMEKSLSGFSCTGLWPFNPDIFTAEDFLPSMMTDEPQPSSAATVSESDSAPSGSASVIEATMLDAASESTCPDTATAAVTESVCPTTDIAVPHGSTNIAPSGSTGISESDSAPSGSATVIISIQLDSAATAVSESTCPDTPITPTASNKARALIHDISPLPKSKTVRVRTRKVEGAEVVTGSPYKQRVLERTLKKTAKPSAKNKVMKNNESKAKKKLTCRLDKPRGRKRSDKGRCAAEKTKTKKTDRPKGVKAGGNKKDSNQQDRAKILERKGKKHSVCDTDNHIPCLYCGEEFGDSRQGEQWLQCGSCKGWCHTDCSDGETVRGFVCDFCR